jgi:hypothetical protein
MEYLAHQHCRDIRADTADALQTNDFLDHRVGGGCLYCRGLLGFQLADQLKDQDKLTSQAVQLAPQ